MFIPLTHKMSLWDGIVAACSNVLGSGLGVIDISCLVIILAFCGCIFWFTGFKMRVFIFIIGVWLLLDVNAALQKRNVHYYNVVGIDEICNKPEYARLVTSGTLMTKTCDANSHDLNEPRWLWVKKHFVDQIKEPFTASEGWMRLTVTGIIVFCIWQFTAYLTTKLHIDANQQMFHGLLQTTQGNRGLMTPPMTPTIEAAERSGSVTLGRLSRPSSQYTKQSEDIAPQYTQPPEEID